MAKLYSKGGDCFEVPHAIDVRDWLKEGYSLTPPEAEVVTPEQPEAPEAPVKTGGESFDLSTINVNPEPPVDPEQPETDAEWFESVKGKLGTLGAEDVQRAAKIAGVEYTNKRDAVAAIKDKIQ